MPFFLHSWTAVFTRSIYSGERYLGWTRCELLIMYRPPPLAWIWSMSAMMRSLLCWPPQIAQWMGPDCMGGFGKEAAASATVGTVISRHGSAARSGKDKQASTANRDTIFIG